MMWAFGDEGVRIFSGDGSETLKSLPKEKVCHNVTNRGSYQLSCRFYDVVSDGKKYVWTSVSSGESKIDVFSIDTGDLVGSFETCKDPYNLDYHQLRDEVWVHCGAFSDIENSHMDVFSAISPSLDIKSRVTLHDGTATRSWGKLAVHNSLGDVGYSTVYGSPLLNKIDLNTKELIEQFEMPDVYAVYDLAYSPKNAHLFLRTQVCCTCGFEGADTLECGRYGSSNITATSGPFTGQEVEGMCGRHCEGGPNDNKGIYEFDTNSDKLVATHNFPDGFVEAPFASPDGDYIVIFGMDGGKRVRVLEAGEPGQPSHIKWDLELDFDVQLNEEMEDMYGDFSYIQHPTRDGGEKSLFVLSSRSENKVVIVDVTSGDPEISYVHFREGLNVTETRYNRQVEHMHGTPYVWVSGRNAQELYIIDVEKKELVNTLTEVHSRQLLSVVNYEHQRRWGSQRGFGNTGDGNSVSLGSSLSSASAASQSTNGDGSSSSNDALSIAAIALATVAIVAVLVNLVVSHNQAQEDKKRAASAANKASNQPLTCDNASVDLPPSVQ